MVKRVFNFNPGPATLPLEVVEEASRGMLEFNNLGMSIMEISHRSKDFEKVIQEAAADLKELLGLDDRFRVAFMGGGASLQFAMIPMNFLREDGCADYIDTGEWASKAIKEAKLFGKVNVVGSSADKKFSYIPDWKDLAFTPGAAYVHVTSNNTIEGTEFHEFPKTGGLPLIVDMSSDLLARRLDHTQFALIYAGAQKNVGPAGVTIAVVRDDLLAKVKDKLPSMLSYKTHIEKESLYNTPPAFAIYVVGLVMKWVKKEGGVAAIEQRNREKAGLLYDAIDSMPAFYKGTVEKGSRSLMNVTFRLPSEALEEAFVKEAKARELVGLKGHRSVGGIRASLYNALPVEGVRALLELMKDFAKRNG
jgi:phosphoserine aminotransferase